MGQQLFHPDRDRRSSVNHRADDVQSPAGVLSVTAPSTIPITGFTTFNAAIEESNLTEDERADFYGYLGGEQLCGIAIGAHPYATKTLTIGLTGSYTFRIVGTKPISHDVVLQPGVSYSVGP